MTTVASVAGARARRGSRAGAASGCAGRCAAWRPRARRAPGRSRGRDAPSSPPQIPYSCWIETTSTQSRQRLAPSGGSRPARRGGSGDGPRSGSGDGLLGRMEGDDLAAAGAGGEVAGEGRDPAASRRIGGDEGSPNDGVLLSVGARALERSRGVPDDGGAEREQVPSDDGRGRPAGGGPPCGGPVRLGGAHLLARGPLGLASISNVTCSPPTRRSKSSEESRPPRWKKYSFSSSAAMKPKPRSATTFLMVPVVMMDLQHFPNRDCRAHGPFEKGVDHAEPSLGARSPTIAQMFDGTGAEVW